MAKMTVSPHPANRGEPLTLCYEFDPDSASVVIVEITSTPTGLLPKQLDFHLEDAEDGVTCKSFEVPPTAQGYLFTDLTGAAPEIACSVNP